MQWFGIQSVIQHQRDTRESAIYEERVVLYFAASAEQAISRAQRDTAAYLESNPGFSLVSVPSIFSLHENVTQLDGAEVWSCLHQGPTSAKVFWQERYQKYSLAD